MFRAFLSRHVHFSDCDPAQIVFYPRYFIWFDQATENMFRLAGMPWETTFEAHDGGFAGVPLLDASADFKSPCKMGDHIEIETWVDDWREKVFTVLHRIHNNGRLAVEGRETRIWVVRAADREAGIRSAPIPGDVRTKLSAE
ncbi:MAG: acyl-CoA thioesterase [Alphaproteobacteria bacterium]|nr:acyl-CoA thioesterase [Alphaproteobacteria bacterium]